MRTASRPICFSFLRRLFLRRYLYTIPLALILCTPFVCAQENVIELTNADVLAMVRSKVPANAIIEKIQTSHCHFDTFPTVISELRYRGVAEEILVAMVEAPIGRPRKRVEKKTTTAEADSTSPTRSEVKPTDIPARVSTAPKVENPTRRVTVTRGDKTITETSAGKAAMPSTLKPAPTERTQTESDSVGSKEAPTNGSAAPSSKQERENRAATLPLPEPARLVDWKAAPPTNVVMTGPPEKRLPESTISEPKPAPQVLTNSDIIKLLRGGSPVAKVVAAIKASPGNYDLSAKALLELREVGADATVFLSMMEVNQRIVANKSAAPASSASVPSKKPEQK